MPSLEKIIRENHKLRRLAEIPYFWLSAFGIDPLKLIRSIGGLPVVIKEYVTLKKQNRETGNRYKLKFNSPCPHDKYAPGGAGSGHYFHQDLLVARRIFQRKPIKHVDVGSRVDGFVAHVASFRTIEVFDIRPQSAPISNIVFKQVDFMHPKIELTAYCDSLSSLHALEHFGLGRYGDPININGHLLGLDNLYKILQPNGVLYLSVPIGSERIDFNSHRVFAIQTILETTNDRFELIRFSYVDDKGDFHENIKLDSQNIHSNCGCYYGCGIFEFKKVK